MTPLSSWALIGYTIGLKVALVAALVSRYRWRKYSVTLQRLNDDDAKRWARDINAQVEVAVLANRMVTERHTEVVRLRNALANVVGIIGRRPPRRRWLALARRIAQLAA